MTSLAQNTLSIAQFEQESLSSSSILSIECSNNLKKHLKAFNESFERITTKWNERCEIAQFIFSSLLRLLNRSVLVDDCKINDIRISISCTECLNRIYLYTNTCIENDVNVIIFITLINKDKKIDNIICNIIILLISILEALKIEENCKGFTSSDIETLSFQCFSIYKQILKCWTFYHYHNKTENYILPQAITGPCLAQFIQSSLYFSKHSSKTLAEEALKSLYEAIKYTRYAEDWRSYFPGTFSGLHTLSCSMVEKRGSTVLSAALECLISLINSITDDRLSGNKSLLMSQQMSGSKVDIFKQMKTLSNDSEISDSIIQSKDNALPTIFTSYHQMQEWRVDILQKIEKYFPLAFKAVYTYLSPKQRVLSINSLSQLLLQSRLFLGHIVYCQFLLLIVPASDDNTFIVREAARKQFLELKEIEMKNGSWSRISSTLTDKFVEIVENGLDKAGPSLDKSSKVQENVTILVGIGELLNDDLAILLKAGGSSFIKKVIALLLPDLDGGSKTQLLDARHYYVILSDNNVKSFVGSYYRLPWLSTGNDNCKISVRKLCFLMGKYGALLDVSSFLSGLQSSLEKQLMQSINSSNRKDGVSTKLVDRVLAGWIFVCNGVLGFSKITKLKRTSDTMPCGLCGVSTIPRRCTKCLSVSYCSKEHQQEHWIQHKVFCIDHKSRDPNSETDAIDKNSVDVYYENDVMDPDTLMTVPHFICSVPINHANYKSVNNIIKAAMQQVNFYLKWTNNHLQSLSFEKSIHSSSDISLVLSQAVSSEMCVSTTNLIMRLSLITATCVECIANCLFLVGINYRDNLFGIIYPLLELLCDPYPSPILRQAVNTSLIRIASYLHYDSLSELFLDVLDSVVDRACSSLRNSYQERMSRQGSSDDFTIKTGVWRTHLIIDIVLNELSDNIFVEVVHNKQSKITTTFALLSEIVTDTMKNIDRLIMLNYVPNEQISSIIRVMLVLVRRTLPKVDIESLSLSSQWLNKSYIMKRMYKSQYFISNSILTENIGQVNLHDTILSEISTSLSNFRNALVIFEGEQRAVKDSLKYENEELKDELSNEAESPVVAEEEVDAEDNNATPTPGMKLILEILERCTYFLAQTRLGDQVLIIEIIASSFLRLSINKRVLYPAVHRVWPAIINRLKEQARLFTTSVNIPDSNEYTKKKEKRSSDLLSFGQSTMPRYSSLILGQTIEQKTVERPMIPLHSHILLLPPLLELLLVTAAVCDDFLAIKFYDDIWPQFQIILRHNSLIDWGNMINYDQSTNHSFHDISKFSLTVKLKQALLSCINQFATLPKCSIYVKSKAKYMLWFLIPFLCSHQSKEVVELAMIGIQSFYNLDPAFGFILFNSIIDNQLIVFSDIIRDPCINDAIDKKIYTMEVILRYYRKDLGLLERLQEVINETKENEIASVDGKWLTNLKQWSAI